MIIDAHVHLWDIADRPGAVPYPWLTPDLTSIYRTFRLADVRAEMDAHGVAGLVLVQASDSLAETDALLAVAAADDRPVRVVGWLPLDDPAAVDRELRARAGTPLVGVRHLIHDEPDPRWLLRPGVNRSLGLLADAGLSFDAVAERPDLLALVPRVAARHPDLTVVLDHVGKPPIAAGGWQPWAGLVADAARAPGVVAKVSGLNTVSRSHWTSDDWRPYIAHASDVFGSERLMLGGDWPFCLQNGTYDDVLSAFEEILSSQMINDVGAIEHGTAERVYQF